MLDIGQRPDLDGRNPGRFTDFRLGSPDFLPVHV